MKKLKTVIFIISSCQILSAQFNQPPYQAGFPVTFSNMAAIIDSSPAVYDLDNDGDKEIIVGTSDGNLLVINSDGSLRCSFSMPRNVPISGKPAIGDVDGDNEEEIIVTFGFQTVDDGAVYILEKNCSVLCFFEDFASDFAGFLEGTRVDPTLGNFNPTNGLKKEIFFGSFNSFFYIMETTNGTCSIYWRECVGDTIWASAAAGEITLDFAAAPDIAAGNDTNSANPPDVDERFNGGVTKVFKWNPDYLNTPLRECNYLGVNPSPSYYKKYVVNGRKVIDEVVWSSPVIGDINADGVPDIVFGKGNCWEDPACAPFGNTHNVLEEIYAIDQNGNDLQGWPFQLRSDLEDDGVANGSANEYVASAVSLGDIVGNDGVPEVIFGSKDRDAGDTGRLYVVKGDGSLVWSRTLVVPGDCAGTSVQVNPNASPVIADVTGDDRPEIIVPGNWDVVIFDADGNQLTWDSCPGFIPPDKLILRMDHTISSSVAVDDIDGDGDIEVIAAGGDSNGAATIAVWDFPKTSASLEWPQHRMNHLNTATYDNYTYIYKILIDSFESGDTSLWSNVVE